MSISEREAPGTMPLRLAALLSLTVILLVTGWLYFPGISGPDLLDDRSSVAVIEDLRERPEVALDYIFGDDSGPLGRPVSVASFVLERIYTDGAIATSKLVNIAIHLVNGLLVVWLLWLLFRHIGITMPFWLAALAGGAWLLSPLHVSTVLYVVQRMAMLATLFMLLATISYVYWRMSIFSGTPRHLPLLLVVVFFLLALFSKENAVVLIPILLTMEALWFGFQGPGGQVITRLRNFTLGAMVLGFCFVAFFLLFQLDDLREGYLHRVFTLEQRLLTESRILWDYLGQLVWPDVHRMGLYHDDYVVSTGLDEPRSTLYALAGWLVVAVTGAGMLFWQSGRYLFFAVSWYLLGHGPESTFLPLELYFEHRNYYPGIGIFLGIGLLVGIAIKKWPEIRGPSLAWMGIWVFLLSMLTSSQVQIWSSRPLLVLAHLNGHPNSFRANTDMAVQMASLGEVEAAREYSARAFAVGTEEREGDYQIRDLALNCIASRPVSAQDIDKVGVADPNRPLSSVATLITLVRMLQDDRCPEFDREYFADRMAEIFLVENFRYKASANIYSSLAVLENALGRYDNALGYTERFLALDPDSTRALLMKLHFTTALGKVDEAQAVIAQLKALDQSGQLTAGERRTLSLYLENG